MLVDPDNYPSFCKLLFKEGFMDKIVMPPVFVKEQKMLLAKTCILKTEEGLSWEAKIVRENSDFFISKGDWSQFVMYHRLELGDILLFFLVGKSTFQVLRYRSFKKLRGQPVFEELSSFSSEEERDIGPSRKSKELVKMEPEGLSYSQKERVGPSRGSKEISGINLTNASKFAGTEQGKTIKKSKADPSKEEIHSAAVNFLKEADFLNTTLSDVFLQLGSHFGADLMHRKAEVKAVVDDILHNMIDKKESSSDSEEESIDPSSDSKDRCYTHSESKGSSRMHKKQSRIVYAKNETVMDKEGSIAYQRAKAFKTKNPFIILFMQPSYVSKRYMLNVSFPFARKYFQNCSNLVLRVQGKGSWPVTCNVGVGTTKVTIKARIICGWKAFVVDNQLKIGDVCVFEVINGGFIDVAIFRAAGRACECTK